jgi:hypothetical protein
MVDATALDFHGFPNCAEAQTGGEEFALVESIRAG